MKEVIKFDNVSFKYEAEDILKGVDFEVERGEIVGLIGGSGSTVGKLITREIKPTYGRVRVDSSDVLPIFQHAYESFNPKLKLRKYLVEPLVYYRGVPVETANAQIERDLADFHLSHQLLNKYPDEVSGGELQRLNVLRTFSASPEILICDEITSNLDVFSQRTMNDMLQQYHAKTGHTILIISHNLEALYDIVDRFLVLEKGYLVDDFLKMDMFQAARHPYTKLLMSGMR
ncbi:ATP-binding cassette domain-containing protein [Staphylococcus massiliensis]|uniref:ABC transporter ATP-binding protein n=1 Tax=Staphylococcus massiliensis TaxID=555791 RepID=UPI001EDFF3D1|nr:ATP-binding cassette domain-containing protein [Staphylococcus massiliensis]